MDVQLELIDCLRKKLFEARKKSAARKNALKQLEKAYLISQNNINLYKSEKIRFHDLYNATLKDYTKLQLDYKDLQQDSEALSFCFEEQLLLNKQLLKERKPKSWWKFWL